MPGMKRYYLSRGLLSILFGGLVYIVSSSIWVASVSIGLTFIIFVMLSGSERYKVNPENGFSALQRDEWAQRINDKSGRNAWVIVTIAGSVIILYCGLISLEHVPVYILGILIIAGVITYYVSDFWQRRFQSAAYAELKTSVG